MINVAQCPKCELLFAIRTQLEDHLQHDHPDFHHVYEPSSARNGASAGAGAVPAPGFRHVLVVANQTLTSDNLLEVIKSRVAAGPCDFSIVLPSAVATGRIFDAAPPKSGASHDGEEADENRLTSGQRRFHAVGATVDGHVAHADPLAAVSTALSKGSFDEVIISTLPRSSSRWWKQDLATKVQRRSHLPVTVVSAEGASQRH